MEGIIVKRSKVLSLAMVLVLSIVIVNCGREDRVFFSITTGGVGGTYYPIGGALAQILRNNVPDVSTTAQTGNASVANCNLIRSHEIQSALTQNNVAYWAYTGTERFADQKPAENLRAIASLYRETIQIVARKSAKISQISDMRGKRIIVGAPGSGTEIDARKILAAHGITYDDIKEDFLDFSGATQRLKDNQADAAFLTAGYPTSSVIDLSATANIVLVPIEADMIDKLMAESGYYTRATIPAGTYAGIDVDIPTVTLMAIWAVDADESTDLVYKITKALWENRDDLEKVHDKCKEITFDTALDGLGVPLHPGAEKYYREMSHPGIAH